MQPLRSQPTFRSSTSCLYAVPVGHKGRAPAPIRQESRQMPTEPHCAQLIPANFTRRAKQSRATFGPMCATTGPLAVTRHPPRSFTLQEIVDRNIPSVICETSWASCRPTPTAAKRFGSARVSSRHERVVGRLSQICSRFCSRCDPPVFMTSSAPLISAASLPAIRG
jgi:hypothetical protein